MPTKVNYLAFFISVILVLAFSISCTPDSLSTEKEKGDILIIPEYQSLVEIHPILARTTLSTRLSQIVFDGLIRLNEDFEPYPHLAQFWERSEDGRIWKFRLRSGIKFHDGVELTADDVAFTFHKLMNPKIGRNFLFIFKEVEKIVAKDRYTVEFFLKKPISSFLQNLHVGILPKHLLEGEDFFTTSFNDHPVGTGPFQLKFWSEKDVRLEANPSYFLGTPYLKQIQVKVYPTREAAWAKLLSGEADFFYWLTPENYELLKQVPSFRIFSVPRPYYYMISFNFRNKIFMDQKVRQALNYAINKKGIVKKILYEQGQVSSGPIMPGAWAMNPDVQPYPYDPKRALALLEEAGWEDHDGDHFLDRNQEQLKFTVYINVGDNLKEKTSLIIQQNLMDIGVKMYIKFFDASDISFLINKDFQAIFPELRAFGDPDVNYLFWHSSQIEDGVNFTSYNNPLVDKLLEQGRTEFDPEKRKKVYFQFQEEIHEDPPGIFLFWTNLLIGFHERFHGVQINYAAPIFFNVNELYVPKKEQRYTHSTVFQ